MKRCLSKEGHNKGKDFAVKIIKTKELIPKIVSKLDKESRICKALMYPNIVISTRVVPGIIEKWQ